MSERDDWPTLCCSKLLLDTLLEVLSPTEVKDLDVWYGRHEVQKQVYSVSYKITTDDKFLQNMMRSVDALPARTEADLESVNGRSAEFFKTSVLYARRKLIPRLSFQTSVIYRETYGRKMPLSAMDDSCMILWGQEQETLPTLRGFSAGVHGCAGAHASVEDLHGHLLVRQDICCGARWHHHARLSHSRAR